MGLGGSKIKQDDGDRYLVAGRPDLERCDNMITTAKYTIVTFLPVAIMEQFRRFANLYFLAVGIIMAIGTYADHLFESAISPWTTLGPLAFVVSVSLLVEGTADLKRHQSDYATNSFPCVILRRADELAQEEGTQRETQIFDGKDVKVTLSKSYHETSNNQSPETPRQNDDDNNNDNNIDSNNKKESVKIAFQKVRRMDIRQGHLVLVRNRESVPADMILLASSGDGGSAYIETSSIDGETNLKLRTSPNLPKHVLKHLRGEVKMDAIVEELEEDEPAQIETLEQATKRVTRFSALAYPDGESALSNPNYHHGDVEEQARDDSKKSFFAAVGDGIGRVSSRVIGSPSSTGPPSDNVTYIAALTSEPPNPHVNTFSGKLTLPPIELNGPCHDIPLGAENILLRGAVVRNTEWLIGLSCFTGTDTKLVQNSFQTPSKFSQLDVLMNWTVVAVIFIMFLCISYLASQAVNSNKLMFDDLWYVGLNKDTSAPWPYLPDLEPPPWDTSTPNWIQMFFLYVTLLSNFVPLSMYVTVEAINFMFLWLIYVDLNMYDDTTDTRALARSTNVTDLGRIQYIFSDKTGTLTQNVMRFKRCSVDGMMFGTPIQRARPGAEITMDDHDDEDDEQARFHPLRHLLVGRIKIDRDPRSTGGVFTHGRPRHASSGLDGLAPYSTPDGTEVRPADDSLTFNAEWFLRVLSLCHTVVVEKDLDLKETVDTAKSVSSHASSWSAKNYSKKLFGGRNRTASDMSTRSDLIGTTLTAVVEEGQIDASHPGDQADLGEPPAGVGELPRSRAPSTGSYVSHSRMMMEKGADGAPAGFAYQAESPDEGALVSAASKQYGFQVIGRDSSGIRLRCAHPTILHQKKVVEGLKSGTVTPKVLAAESAQDMEPSTDKTDSEIEAVNVDPNGQRIETWSILAVNKFDSDRKRMSILLRSPPELGSLPILLCKGADSAMLDPEVCTGAHQLVSDDGGRQQNIPQQLEIVKEDEYADTQDEWEMAQMLGIQSHLGYFASEGLRTLVLGVKFLTEDELENWISIYKTATTSIKNRDELLKEAALKIEKGLHIVGATAIEDKLQKNVPDTIATLGKAGIKLWVLTGDKRETAIEIGYSTNVLTPRMHITEVADKGVDHVRTQCAMEFIRLVKAGKLPHFQKQALEDEVGPFSLENLKFALGKCTRSMDRIIQRFMLTLKLFIWGLIGMDTSLLQEQKTLLEEEQKEDDQLLKDLERRRAVRSRADKLIQAYLESPEGQAKRKERRKNPEKEIDAEDNDDADLSLSSDEVPAVFNRAHSAREILSKTRDAGQLTSSEVRAMSLAQLTVQQTDEDAPLVDEDTLSLRSFLPKDGDLTNNFNKKKRTILEKLFAVDKAVRGGRLVKHLTKEKRAELDAVNAASPLSPTSLPTSAPGEGPRALVIEGAALKHLLGDPELEEIIFSIASNCDAVIACRVSPRQKALLVKLVRKNVVPEPVTLAIGDGANDVGMIQEAHVGVGVSGKEGQQAVNASDFAIAQFRFLEDLVLIHGRWNFFRMSAVVLFSFYKNAVLAGCLIVFNGETVYSGTPLFDEWVIAVLNFVSGVPILFLGLFDRPLSKEYVRNNPEVYRPTQMNELITFRVLVRWVILVFAHVFCLYYATVPVLSDGGGMTSAFVGLMSDGDPNRPGDGEGGDIQSIGTITYTCLVILLAYKVLYESNTLIHGRLPACDCNRNVCEGLFSRIAYSWVGVTYCSIFFYFVFLWRYEVIAERNGPGTFFNFVGVTGHVLATRSVHWMLILFVPIAGMTFDVAGKVFSNMFYPTQTQIHMEIQAKERAKKRRRERRERNSGQSQTTITEEP